MSLTLGQLIIRKSHALLLLLPPAKTHDSSSTQFDRLYSIMPYLETFSTGCYLAAAPACRAGAAHRDCPVLAVIGGEKDTMVTAPAQEGGNMGELGRKVGVDKENFLHNIKGLFWETTAAKKDLPAYAFFLYYDRNRMKKRSVFLGDSTLTNAGQ